MYGKSTWRCIVAPLTAGEVAMQLGAPTLSDSSADGQSLLQTCSRAMLTLTRVFMLGAAGPVPWQAAFSLSPASRSSCRDSSAMTWLPRLPTELLNDGMLPALGALLEGTLLLRLTATLGQLTFRRSAGGEEVDNNATWLSTIASTLSNVSATSCTAKKAS